MATWTPRGGTTRRRAGATLSESERAVLSVVGTAISVMIGGKPYDEEQDFDAEVCGFDTVSISINGKTSIRLTQLTVAELSALRDIFNDSIDLAMPICAELDRLATEAAETGDDDLVPLLRAYRSNPTMVIRQRIAPRSPER